MKDFINLNNLSASEINNIFEITSKLKHELKSGIKHPILEGKTLGMIFTKSSTRTRVSFEVGIYQLGGYPLFLNANDIQLGRGETIYDTANVLSRFIDGIMIRTYKQSDIEDLAKYSTIPVINGLSDLMHPCQALADLFTVLENKKVLKGLKLSYVGDGNNVAHSLLHACTKLGVDISIGAPKGYECDETIINEALENSKISGSKVCITNDPIEAVKESDVVYTDTWTSMGQETEKEQRIDIFKDYQVNKNLFSYAKKDAIFLHCLPAYRGHEVTGDIIDGNNSLVFEESENRLHVQKAIMSVLMK